MSHRILIAAIAALVFASASKVFAHGEDADVRSSLDGAKIVAGAYVDSTNTFTPDERVFAYEFGEDPDDPFGLGDPGYNNVSGNGFTPGSRMGIRVLSDLLYWDGTGAVALGAVPDSETLSLIFGLNSRTAGTGTGQLADFYFGPVVGAGGSFHEHLTAALNGSDGNRVPADDFGDPVVPGSGDGAEATAGIYFLEVSVINDAVGVEASDSIWLIFNAGGEDFEEAHEAAIEHVESMLEGSPVPTPGAAAAGVALLGLAALRRRRR